MPASAKVKDFPGTFTGRLALFDVWGSMVFIPANVSLLLALKWGGSKYPWNDQRIIALLVVFGILTTIFIAIQLWKQDSATIPPRILKQRSIWGSAVYSFFIGATLFVLLFFVPIWLQAIRSVSPLHSGVDTLPMILAFVLGTIFAGALIARLGYFTPFMIASSMITAVGTGLLSMLKVNSGPTKWIPFETICGLGVGLGMQQSMLAAQATLPLSDVPIGTSIVMFSEILGASPSSFRFFSLAECELRQAPQFLSPSPRTF
jgi:hypothetical protein